MLELFEKTLVYGGDLETARQTLLNEANQERMNRNAMVEHDYKVALLIRECLMTEPRGTAGYAVAKGVMNRIKEKYQDPEANKIVRKLHKTINEEERKKIQTNDGKEGTAETAGNAKDLV